MAGATSSGGAGAGGVPGTGGSVIKDDAGHGPDSALADAALVVTCPAPVAPEHGDVIPSSLNVGGVATYTCAVGHVPPTPSTRTCQTDGTWSGVNPVCAPVDCGQLPRPANGSVDAPTTTYEATATYACDLNFGLVGNATRSCQANGTWSGTTPACQCVQTMCNGVCVDLKTDNRNCGGCGTACSAVSPSTAQCTPTGCLVTLATAVTPGDIAVDASNVYWADSNAGNAGTVSKVPLGGGVATTLASDQHYPGGLAVDATNVYWASWNDEEVRKVPIAGGPVVTLSTGENGPCCLAVNATDIYYLSNRGVMRIPLAGGSASAVASTDGPAFSLVLDAANLYWRVDLLGGTTEAKLMKQSLQPGSLPTTLTTSSSMGALAVDATNVYWTLPAGTIAGAGAVAKLPIDGGTSTTLASGLDEPSDVAVDGTHVYFTCRASGTVMKVPVAGGTPTVIASDQRLPSAIAVDGASVYWTNWGGSTTPTGSVVKLSPK